MLLFLSLNLILKNRDKSDDDNDHAPKDWRRHIEPRPETEPEDNSSFYDDDDDDILDEFEENPAILSRKPKKKAKQEKEKKQKRDLEEVQPVRQEKTQKEKSGEQRRDTEEVQPSKREMVKQEKLQKQEQVEDLLADLGEEEPGIPNISLDIDDELEFLDLNDL